MASDSIRRPGDQLPESGTSSQRARVLNAVIDLGAERGFQTLTITDIITRAGVTRRSFNAFFEDKESCCIAALDYAGTEIVRVLVGARRDPGTDLPLRIDAYIGALLDVVSQRPALIQMLATDAGLPGPTAAAHQRELRARIAEAVLRLSLAASRYDPRMRAPTGTRSLAVVGAVNEIIQQTLHTSGPAVLPQLRDQLTDLVVVLLHK